MKNYDVIVIGAGGAGLMCAIQAGRRGRKVAVLDHAAKIGSKILISGGGRCNFTNVGAGPENYVSNNPHFAKSALSRFVPNDFIHMVKDHQIAYHEKKLGQLFCDRSAQEIVAMLEEECRKAGVEILLEQPVIHIEKNERFEIKTFHDSFSAESLVIATGGLSIPKLGATDFGYKIAKQFGLRVVPPSPALDGFKLKPADMKYFKDLMGVSCDTIVTCGKGVFRENILFTHSGLSGPAALQASLYWYPGNTIQINFIPSAPKETLEKWFLECKRKGSKLEMKTLLKEWLPSRLADRICENELHEKAAIHQMQDKKIKEFCNKLKTHVLSPEATVGYSKAEVTRGGVDTDELSSRTMESKKVPGLYFVGEVVDVTGWLGGYNFQWAWASGYAAGDAV
ncbi:MAG TPA: NAD(P)/FAD-dependent oxidoreductase [bacterium]|nr:NAD(P)/FAD-dependent oxidoreductase [bacterium]